MIEKGIKIITLLLICFLVMSILGIGNLKVYADKGLDPTEDPDSWKTALSANRNTPKFKNKINIIVTIVRNIGILASVITLAIIGIKYMIGSVDEKAQYKQTLMPWIIGAILVFAITLLPTIIFNITNENKSPGSGDGREPNITKPEMSEY